MARPTDGSVSLKLGEQTLKLRYDFNAIAAIEEETGRSLLKNDLFDLTQARDVRALLYGGLLHEHPRMTLLAAGRLINLTDGDEMRRLMETIVAALRAAGLASEEPDEDTTDAEPSERESVEGNVIALPQSSTG